MTAPTNERCTVADTSLIDLAVRCEGAEGADREIDLDILIALHPGARRKGIGEAFIPEPGWEPGSYSRIAVHYTASIDAALTLVPEGWVVASLTQDATGWWAGLRPAVASVTTEWTGGWGPTPSAALAFCAASLRARALL